MGVEAGEHLVAAGAVVGHDVEVGGGAQRQHLLVAAEEGEAVVEVGVHDRALEAADGGEPPPSLQAAYRQGAVHLVGVEEVDAVLAEQRSRRVGRR